MRIVLLIACIVVPSFVFSHETGQSYEEMVGMYVVDIGYDTSSLVSGERTVFDFSLRDVEGKSIAFDYVWVRILSGENLLLATGIARSPNGATTLAYGVPPTRDPDITIEARFQYEGTTLAEAKFSLPVDSSWPLLASNFLGATLIGLLSGIFISYFLRGRTSTT